MRKFMTILGAALLLASQALASQNTPLPNYTTVIEPNQLNAAFNGYNQTVNTKVDGLMTATSGSVATTLTTIQPLLTYTLPANFFGLGQAMHIKAWGVNTADANVKTITFAFGATTCAVIVTGSANNWFADFYVQITAIGASPTQTDMCYGQTAATAVAVSSAAGGTVATGSPVTVLVQGTAATGGTITLQGAYIEQVE